MDNQEEELNVPKKDEEAIDVETRKGGHSMISPKRLRRVGTKPLFENWEHESDREQGDNDPNERISKRK